MAGFADGALYMISVEGPIRPPGSLQYPDIKRTSG